MNNFHPFGMNPNRLLNALLGPPPPGRPQGRRGVNAPARRPGQPFVGLEVWPPDGIRAGGQQPRPPPQPTPPRRHRGHGRRRRDAPAPAADAGQAAEQAAVQNNANAPAAAAGAAPQAAENNQQGGPNSRKRSRTASSRNLHREPVGQRRFRAEVLRHFKCPFEEESICRHEDRPERCMFAHVRKKKKTQEASGAAPVDLSRSGTTAATEASMSKDTANPNTADPSAPPAEADLRTVPSYACIYSLLNSCANKNLFFHRRLRAKPSTTNPNEPTFKQETPVASGPGSCTSGLHLNPEDLVDLETFESNHAEEIAKFFGPDRERECTICFEKVLAKLLPKNRRFGILLKCTHVFCSSCLVEWRTRSANCPVCREPSEKMAISRRWIEEPAEKEKLFTSIKADAAGRGRGRNGAGGAGGDPAGPAAGPIPAFDFIFPPIDFHAEAEQLIHGAGQRVRLDRGNNLMVVDADFETDEDDEDADFFDQWGVGGEDEDAASLSGESDLDFRHYDDFEDIFGPAARHVGHGVRFDDLERDFDQLAMLGEPVFNIERQRVNLRQMGAELDRFAELIPAIRQANENRGGGQGGQQNQNRGQNRPRAAHRGRHQRNADVQAAEARPNVIELRLNVNDQFEAVQPNNNNNNVRGRGGAGGRNRGRRGTPARGGGSRGSSSRPGQRGGRGWF